MKLVHFGRFALAASGLAMAMAVPAHAQLITNNHATQVTLTVAPATVEATARSASVSMSGSGLGALTMPVITAAGVITTAGSAAAPATSGGAFSYSQSVADEDTVAPVAITSGQLGTLPTYSSYTAQAGGTAGTLAGIASSDNGFTTGLGGAALVAGGVGTTASVLQQNSVTVFK